MEKNVNITNFGVKVSLNGDVKKQNILKIVENCSTGACACMSDETKQKIKNIEVDGVDGKVELKLTGDITKEEIEQALQKSKVLNNKE